MGAKFPVSAEGQVLQPAPPAIVKPGLFTQCILVLAGAADFRADSAAALKFMATSRILLHSAAWFLTILTSFNVLVLLDLMDRVQSTIFYGGVLLLPPASTWSRVRHTGTGQWPLQSRSKPMGLLEAATTTVFSTPTKWWSSLGGCQQWL